MSNVKGPDEAQNPDFEELVAQYQFPLPVRQDTG